METVVSPGPDAATEQGLDPTLDLHAEIERLRRQRKAVILAHYYQDGEIQDLADFVGDSLDLSRRAAATDADVIVFCGVRFMGEVAKIVSPRKTVLIPDADAGCSLEESCRPDAFRRFRDEHPDHLAVTYINCSAAVKALSDVIVTSSNAEAILAQLPADRPVLFAPDRHLGAYLAKKSGRPMTLWPGSCIVHEQFSERELVKLKVRHPKALITAHPECPEGIPAARRPYRLDALDPRLRAGQPGGRVHHRHRAAHYSPDAESGAVEVVCRGGRHGWQLRLRPLSVYGQEYLGKDLSLPAQQRSPVEMPRTCVRLP